MGWGNNFPMSLSCVSLGLRHENGFHLSSFPIWANKNNKNDDNKPSFLGGCGIMLGWDHQVAPQSAVRLRAGAIHQLGGLLSRFLGRGMAGVRVARTSARPVHPSGHHLSSLRLKPPGGS